MRHKSPLRFVFREEATMQAIGVLLKAAGGRMDKRKLITILYLADRESLAETGWPITGAQPIARSWGPSLLEVEYMIGLNSDDCEVEHDEGPPVRLEDTDPR